MRWELFVYLGKLGRLLGREKERCPGMIVKVFRVWSPDTNGKYMVKVNVFVIIKSVFYVIFSKMLFFLDFPS